MLFQYAIDIEVAHKSWGIEPEKFTIPGTWQKPNLIAEGTIKLDESEDIRAVVNEFDVTPDRGEIKGNFEAKQVTESDIKVNKFRAL